MVAGQYHHSKGIFYGGRQLQPSLQKLEQELLQRHPDIFRDAPSLTWIDVHTGLGPFGKDSVHYHQTKPSSDTLPLRQAAGMQEKLFSTAFSVTSSMSEQETSEAFVGYDLSKGMLTEYLAESYNGSGMFLVQEFGTLPAILVGRGLILDNMLYQRYLWEKDPGEQAASTRDTTVPPSFFTTTEELYRSPWLKNAFYPQSTFWRSSIVERGVALTLQAIELNKLTPSKERK